MINGYPENWGHTKIGDCCEILDSQRIPVNSQERALRNGIYPYYGANGIQGYIDDYIFDCEAVLLAEDGGNFHEYAHRPIAQYVSGKYWVNNHAHILKAKSGYLTKWIFYNLVHKNILNFINGGTRAKLNQADLKEISIPTPPLYEQEKITSILSSVDAYIENISTKIKKLEILKNAVITNLLRHGTESTTLQKTDIGLLPKDWEVASLDDLIEIKHGYAFDGAYFSNERSGYLLLTPGNFHKNGTLYFGERTKYFIGDVDQEYILSNGDVLVVMTDLTKEMTILGNTIILDSPETVLHNQRIGKILYKTDRIDSYYLMCVMNSDHVKSVVKNTATGTTVRHTSPKRILSAQIPLPPLSIQKNISKIIKQIQSNHDVTNQILDKHQSIKRGLMQDLLTGKVTVPLN